MITSLQKITSPYRYNGDELATTHENQENFLLSIDFLIINLSIPVGLDNDIKKYNVNSNFDFELQDFGTSIFKNRFKVFYNSALIGTLLTSPRSKILKPEFAQFQYENHLFYGYDLKDLQTLTTLLVDNLGATFDSINRLDVALDLENKNNFYQEVSKKILNNELIISGKDKKINTYYTTKKGTPDLNGFTIGTRSSSRYLRVYNKTLELTKKPKEYILNAWNTAKLDVKNVWRFEYQLNNTFFRFLEQKAKFSNVSEKITYNVFDISALFLLIERATKNHFELKINTGKSETNKEPDFTLINFNYLKTKLSDITREIIKLKKASENSLISIKRMIKQNFREYYNSMQKNVSYILAFNQLFEDNDNELTQLYDWFSNKKHFYLDEFQKKQRIPFEFDKQLFKEHLTYAV